VVGLALGSVTVYLGAADHHLGIPAVTTGRFGEADRHLRRAVAAHQRLGARPWVALSQHALAGVLRRRGRPGDHGEADAAATAASQAAAALGVRFAARSGPRTS
jgi:hypothetical protein